MPRTRSLAFSELKIGIIAVTAGMPRSWARMQVRAQASPYRPASKAGPAITTLGLAAVSASTRG